jgi:hypothetical protein
MLQMPDNDDMATLLIDNMSPTGINKVWGDHTLLDEFITSKGGGSHIVTELLKKGAKKFSELPPQVTSVK